MSIKVLKISNSNEGIPDVRFFNKFLNLAEGLAVLRLPRAARSLCLQSIISYESPSMWIALSRGIFSTRCRIVGSDDTKRAIFLFQWTFTAAAVTIHTNWICAGEKVAL